MSIDLLGNAVGWRAGAALSVDPVPRTPADPPIEQWSALDRPSSVTANAGGAGRTAAAARGAAIGELLERYAAARASLPMIRVADLPPGLPRLDLEDFTLHSVEQRHTPGFPYAAAYADDRYVTCYALATNEPIALPAGLITTDPDLHGLATSSGLAADPLVTKALLRATQELIERDALMIAWLHGIGAPRAPLSDAVRSLAHPVGADVGLYDLTPAYSPHPVAVVAGTALSDGRPRHAFGLACRETWENAVEKAALEWAQGVVFAGVTTGRDTPTDRAVTPAQVTDFDEHARFYTRRPDLWAALPWWQGELGSSDRPDGRHEPPVETLRTLVDHLSVAGIDLYYRDLTVPDTAACGVRVVRVLSPQLTPIHGDHRWPHVGGTSSDLARRFPQAVSLTGFPSRYPHPLG